MKNKIVKEFPNNSTILFNTGFVSEKISVGKNVIISADHLIVNDGVVIDDNVQLFSENITLGTDVSIGEATEIKPSIHSKIFKVGDCTKIGERTKIRTPHLEIGDYGIIHSEVIFYGQNPCIIGHNCWIGQWTVLNTKENLIIGNNFRVGVQSQIWTHVASGEMIEGCTMYKVAPVKIEDDVWLVGHSIVSPGVTIRKKTTVLPGAIISKDTEEGHCYAGIPAKDITDKYNPYTNIALEEKFIMLKQFSDEFLTRHPEYNGKIYFFETPEEIPSDIPENGILIILKEARDKFYIKNNSVFDLNTKKYRKTLSNIEKDFIYFNLGHYARFVPFN